MVMEKSKMQGCAYLKHFIILLLTSLPVLMFVKTGDICVLATRILILAMIHIVIDFLKEKIQYKYKCHTNKINVILFLCDQAIHIMFILILTFNVTVELNAFATFILDNLIRINYEYGKMIFVLLYISLSGAYFVPLIFNVIYEKVDDYSRIMNEIVEEDCNKPKEANKFINEVKAGKWIGILERIIILVFLFMNQMVSIGFIVAIKSIARFKMMENKIFAEYYLLGTLLSVAYTLILYVLFNNLL
jgi:hypothetical protein